MENYTQLELKLLALNHSYETDIKDKQDRIEQLKVDINQLESDKRRAAGKLTQSIAEENIRSKLLTEEQCMYYNREFYRTSFVAKNGALCLLAGTKISDEDAVLKFIDNGIGLHKMIWAHVLDLLAWNRSRANANFWK